MKKTTSEFNNQLIVAIQDGRYVLNAENANYSYASLHRVFQQAFNKIDLNNKRVNSMLVLGCGAGSIPTIIYKELGLNPKMDAVEIDEKVIALGYKYFDLNQHPNLNIIIDDAMNFVEKTNHKYDLIVVDLFKGIHVPTKFLSEHFFEKVRKLLNPNGEVLLNYVAYNHETKQQVSEIENSLNKSFLNKTKTYRLENINRVFHVKS